MKATFRYILITAARDRLFVLLAAGLIVIASIASLLGGTAITEPLPMAVSFFGGAARLWLSLGFIVFISFHVRRLYDTREIDLMLTKPLSRAALIAAFYAGFLTLALLLLLPVAFLMVLLKVPSVPGFFWWMLSLALELAIVVALATSTAIILRSAVASALGAFGFYVLSRMVGYFLGSADAIHPRPEEWITMLAKYGLKILSTVMPRLDFFAQTEWLVYGLQDSSAPLHFALQAAIYAPLLYAAAVYDTHRKQF
ncbi:MAG: hypothetical protein J0L97_09055 [Alphaproteobacteria bacterium]|nr:hypothetical protein [Alphaproteobacteria bacterium]